MENMKSLAVLTSGGDSPGMNAAIRAVVRTAHFHGLEVYGVERGYQGLIDAQLRPMGPRSVGGIISRGGTILRSARCDEFLDEAGREKGAKTLREHGIDGLVVIGGDGSYRGAHALFEEQGIATVGLPGTIDNDIGGTDFSIGFDTALNTAMEAIDRLRDTADSHDRIFFVEVMGRRSGYLAMMGAIAGGADEILVPESLTDIDALITDLRRCRERGKTSSIVVVAEGDEAGDAMTIADQVGKGSEFRDTRVTVIGHMQRGGSPTAYDRILASRLGVYAVESMLEGHEGVAVGIQKDAPVLSPLPVAWETKTVFDSTYFHIAKLLAT